MKYMSTLLAVRDMEKSKQFYTKILDLAVVSDFGDNVLLTGGIALQTVATWVAFLQRKEEDIFFANHASELYFEENDIDIFMESLQRQEIRYVHPLFEHRWGQRVVRFYDPDGHIIEVGENMAMVVQRFLQKGLSIEETALRMEVSLEYVRACIRKCENDSGF